MAVERRCDGRPRAGRRTKVVRSEGGRRTVSVLIARPLAYNFYSMTACLAGPEVAKEAAQLRRMLASATLPNH